MWSWLHSISFTLRLKHAVRAARFSTDDGTGGKGVESALLWLLREPKKGLAATVLADFDVEGIQAALVQTLRNNTITSTQEDLRTVLRSAKAIALGMRHRYVGSEHFLIGLLTSYRGPATQILTTFGVTTINAEARVKHILYGDPD